MSGFKPVLVVERIRAARNEHFALTIERFSVRPGEVVCLAGANGSGKTTFVEVIAGLILGHGGAVAVSDRVITFDDPHAKRSIGYIPDDDAWIIPELTAREFFELLQSVYRRAGVEGDLLRRADKVAGQLGFTAFDLQLGGLSHGNKKKVQIISAVMHAPQLLVIDELRNGLDPLAIIAAEQLLQELSSQGTAIVAATHDLWWAQRVADRIVVLDSGRVVVRGRVASIVKQAGSLEQKFIEVCGKLYEPVVATTPTSA